MTPIDLRSDTVTQPTPAMRAAMMAAPLGDDVFGDDPTVNALQERIAAITGKEAALLMPSGTQSNLCGILAHCGRGDEYIVGQLAHTYRYEGGGAAVFGSVQPQPLAQDAQGRMALADIAAAIKPDDPHFARTRLLCLENTWNGHVMPDDYLQGAAALARSHGLAVHLDGARVFNAAVAQAQVKSGRTEAPSVQAELVEGSALPSTSSGRTVYERPDTGGTGGLGGAGGTDGTGRAGGAGGAPLQAVQLASMFAEVRHIASHFDSLSVCFSKGLGAPVGSALCGPRDLIARALRLRKMAGGGLRQAGLLAACALYALDHHVERLADDHANARRLADGLRGVDGLTVRSAETNIVFVDVADGRGPALLNHLKAQGVLATGLIGLRFVTHLGVGAAGIDRAVAATREFFAQATAGEATAGPRGPY